MASFTVNRELGADCYTEGVRVDATFDGAHFPDGGAGYTYVPWNSFSWDVTRLLDCGGGGTTTAPAKTTGQLWPRGDWA
jgi:hypothetical protein